MPAATIPYETFRFNSGTYQALSPVVAADRAINLYPENNPADSGAKAPAALIGRPGLTSFANIGAGPIRALWAGNGTLFVVSGPRLFQINPSSGAVITDFGAMGASTGTGPAQIVANGANPGTVGGADMLVYDSSIAQVFYANPSGPTMDFVYSGFSLEYLDTFYFVLDDVADNRIAQSATLDGTTWPALTYQDISGTVDKKTRLIVANSYLWVMGQSNIEVWYNAGTAGFTLSRMTNGTINQGIFGGNQTEAAWTAVRIQNTVLWMGANAERGFAQFWRADGLTPVKISTPGIESILASYGDIGDARSFAEEYQGHTFYVTNFPNANSGDGATLVYDLSTNQWHERSYNNAGTPERARPDCFASLQVGGGQPKNFVGDYATNDIYLQDSSYTNDDGTSIVYTRTAPHVSNSQRWLKHQCLTLDAAIGTATPTVAISDDGGVTFGSFADMQNTGTVAGEGIKTWQSWQLGRARDRVYKFVVTTSADLVRIANMWLSVEQGTEP